MVLLSGCFALVLLAFSPLADAVSVERGNTFVKRDGPQIFTTSGSYMGVTNATTGLETYKGIRFAQPPVGSLRFAPPAAITTAPEAVQDASEFQAACPSMPFASSMTEDCLFMNIYRPPGITNTTGLPIVVWFFGEFFVNSAASVWDGSSMVQQSISIGKPTIFITFNYRLDVLGFLAGSKVPAGSLNAGLLDQRMALEYIAANAAAFGGDASKITLFGHSTGGTSVGFHMLYPPQTPFRAAIMNSGTATFQTVPLWLQYDLPGGAYTLLAKNTSCTGSNSFSCLQNLPLSTLFAANAQVASSVAQPSPGDWNVVWYPTLGPSGSMITEWPSAKIASGNFADVPFIIGTVKDEGSMFSTSFLAPSTLSNATRLKNFVDAQTLDNITVLPSTLNQMANLYPIANYPSLYELASTGYADGHYLAPRRLFADAAAGKQNVWSYIWEQGVPGFEPAILGVFHSVELIVLEIFGGTPGAIFPSLTTAYQNYYINFINDLDPGSDWPKYQSGTGPLMQFALNNITTVPDDFNRTQTNFWNEAAISLEFQR